MKESNPPILEYDRPASNARDTRHLVSLSAGLIFLLLSVIGTGWIIMAFVQAMTWKGAENYAELGLVVVGVPLIIFEGIIFAASCSIMLRLDKSSVANKVLRVNCCACGLSVLITIIAIVVGLNHWR